MGDFNNVLFSHERLGDRAVHPRETLPFANSLNAAGLVDHTASGCFFTWNSGGDSVRKWSKIDRCLVNSGWFSLQLATKVEFLRQGLSDHCPLVLTFLSTSRVTPF
ncbi:hypothetical protein IFM89_013010 [Coptis chinensis]|uniref:Uncharacterized protein n=1 Tax=Coptis chinensis TaxID=261450 RepID=A0A835GX80_9MAGN|nr:hypothetical protein IFM89_013010 [Coptis chinensis]